MTFKEARINAGYTQEELARKTCIGISTIRNLEQNNSRLGELTWLYGERIRLVLHMEPEEYFRLVMAQWNDWTNKKFNEPLKIS